MASEPSPFLVMRMCETMVNSNPNLKFHNLFDFIYSLLPNVFWLIIGRIGDED